MCKDTLNRALRHTVRVCWGGRHLEAVEAFKALDTSPDTLQFLAEDLETQFKERKQPRTVTPQQAREIQAWDPWPCFASAERLCVLLAGQEWKKGTELIALTDDLGLQLGKLKSKVETALQSAIQSKGYVLVRILSDVKGFGHDYVFVSGQREAAGSALAGYIYQSNIGLLDLNEWVADSKSKEEIDLVDYLAGMLQWFTVDAAAGAKKYHMLSDQPLSDKQKLDLPRKAEAIKRNVSKFELRCKAFDPEPALGELAKLRAVAARIAEQHRAGPQGLARASVAGHS